MIDLSKFLLKDTTFFLTRRNKWSARWVERTKEWAWIGEAVANWLAKSAAFRFFLPFFITNVPFSSVHKTFVVAKYNDGILGVRGSFERGGSNGSMHGAEDGLETFAKTGVRALSCVAGSSK
jgi:hypothetical protein